MAGTLRTLSALDTLFADNTAGDISAQDLRDFLWTSLLEQSTQSPTTGDITGAAGKHYQCDISGLTANRNLTLPASAVVGSRIRVTITTGDDTYALIIKGAATVTINGGSAATEFTRHSAAGDYVEFEATSSTNWQEVARGFEDGSARIDYTSQQTGIPNGTNTKLTGITTVTSDPKSYWDATNTRFNFPCGQFIFTASFQYSTLTGQTTLDLYKNGAKVAGFQATYISSSNPLMVGSPAVISDDPTDYWEVYTYQGSGGSVNGGGAGVNQFFEVVRIR